MRPALLVLLVAGCMEPRELKQVRDAREGRPLDGRPCLVYSQRYQISFLGVEKLHAFDINKYARIYRQLVADGLVRPEDVYVPEQIAESDLLRVHSAAYLERLRDSAALASYLELAPVALLPAFLTDSVILKPFRCATGGTLLAARLALQHGMAINLGGGYHHAEPERGGGFCIYADMPIAIRVLQAEGRLEHVLIVDLDVHQGNGTVLCLGDDDRVFTLDMFEEDIYPHPKEHPDIAVPLSAGTGDEEYVALLAEHLPDAFDRARPDLVFLQAGADTLAGDPLASLALSEDGIVRRDSLVFAEAARRNVPIVMVLGGGYSPQAWHVQYRSIRHLIEQYGRSGPRT